MGLKAFRLNAGLHIQRDVGATADPETGKVKSTTYAAGKRVISDKDLVAQHGAEKFTFLGDVSPQEVQGLEGKDGNRPTGTSGAPGYAQFPANPQAGIAPQVSSEAEPKNTLPPSSLNNTADSPFAQPSVNGGPTTIASGVEQSPEDKAKGEGNDDGPKTLEDQWGPFNEMSVQELKEVAATEEINLGRANKKEEIIKVIKEHEAKGKAK